jgi:hypothetical protein
MAAQTLGFQGELGDSGGLSQTASKPRKNRAVA